MGRKHSISLDIFNSSDSSITTNMSANFTSREIDVSELDNASIHLMWAAGPTGSLLVEALNADKDTWYELDFGVSMAITALDDEAQILLQEMPFNKVRISWIAGTGTGTMTGYMKAKNIGA